MPQPAALLHREGLDTRVVAVGNQKGGVGKTTLTVAIARALTERGRKVLIIDLDMNHGTTNHFLIDPDAFQGSYELLLGAEDAETLALKNDPEDDLWLPENLHIIPAARKLENVAEALAQKNKMIDPHHILVDPVNSIRGSYDYVFLDTGPNATLPTIAAYKAADYFLLTALPETFAVQGLDDAVKDIANARKYGNPKLRLLGVALGRVDRRTRLARELIDYVEHEFTSTDGKSRRFQSEVSQSTIISAAQKQGKTVFETEPSHKITQQIRDLATELEERLAELEVREEPAARLHPAAGEPINMAEEAQDG